MGTLACLYALMCLAGRLGYRVFLYPAPLESDGPIPAGARLVTLRAADGAPVHAIDFPNPRAARTVVYFHGNGDVIDHEVGMAQRLVAQGFAVRLVEYRGYGRSRGSASSPSEEGLYADASAALEDLATHGVGPDRVVLWGMSLGTGVAVEMARRGRGAALVLVAPYTSIPAMAARVTPFLPVGWLVTDRFENLRKAPSLALPTVVVHGTDDEVIPLAMGGRVAAAIPGSRFERIRGGHHMDCFLADGALLRRVSAFIESRAGSM